MSAANATRCPACGEATLEVFFDAGSLPVFVNVLHETEDAARAAPRGEIRLGSCPACDLVHNVAFDAALVEYAPGYENSLHGSPTFQEWARGLAAQLVRENDLEGRRAVDVGGGRGEFARLLVEAGAGEVLVVDPSAPEDAAGTRNGVTVERRLFQECDVDDETSLVLTRHVLEHLSDPTGFLNELSAGGRGLYVEVPNGLWTLRDLGVWDVIYEHCSYFTPSALSQVLLPHRTASVAETFHGQFLSATLGGARAAAAVVEGGAAQRALEADFDAARTEIVERWTIELERARREGRRLALWGTGSKGATFLNSFAPELVGETVACAVDVNPRKHGRFVAGSGHRIVAPSELAAFDVSHIIVLNPAYAAEIEGQARAAGCAAEVLAAAPLSSSR